MQQWKIVNLYFLLTEIINAQFFVYRNAEDYTLVQRMGFTHVLNCAGTRTFDLTKSPYPKDLGVGYFLMMPCQDHDEYDIIDHFPDAIAFIDHAR